jgi:hypothetical protein
MSFSGRIRTRTLVLLLSCSLYVACGRPCDYVLPFQNTPTFSDTGETELPEKCWHALEDPS